MASKLAISAAVESTTHAVSHLAMDAEDWTLSLNHDIRCYCYINIRHLNYSVTGRTV